MKFVKITALLGASVALVLAGPAWAGTAHHGYGETKLAAMADANRAAAEAAREAGTCVTSRATPQSCVQNEGLWDCYAIVANHTGSC